MSENKQQNRFEWMSWGVVILTALLMLVLCRTENVWYDEAYTIALIRHPVKELVEITSKDVHSPFYYLLLKGFYIVLGQTIQSAKIFSVVFLVLFEIVLKYAVGAVWDKKATFYSLVFALLLPSVTVYAADARMYTMGLFFVTLSAVLAYFAVTGNKVKIWVWFTLSCACAMYVHIFTMLAMFVLFLLMAVCILVGRYRNRKNLLCYVCSGAFVTVAYIPWLLVVFKQLSAVKASNIYSEMEEDSYVGYFVQWFSSSWNPNWNTVKLWCYVLVIAGLIYCCGVLIRVFGKGNRFLQPIEHEVLLALMLVLVITPTVLGIQFSERVQNIYMGRYSFPLLGFLCVFLGVVLSRVRIQIFGVEIVPALIAIVLLAFSAKNYSTEYVRQTDTGMNEFREFVDEYVGEKDVYMVDSIHASLFSLYDAEHLYFCPGTKAEMNPFDTKGFVVWEDLGDARQVYLLSFNDEPLNLWIFADDPYRVVKEFDYMMYHVRIYEIDL